MSSPGGRWRYAAAEPAEQQRNKFLILSEPGIVKELPGEVSRLVGIHQFGILMVTE